MSKEICISSTPHETRLAILEDDQLAEIYYERENEYTLAGSIYKGRVTRVLPGMQSAFVEVGLERDAFLYVTDFLEEQGDSADFERVSNGVNDTRRDAAPEHTSDRGSDRSSETASGEEPRGKGERPQDERGPGERGSGERGSGRSRGRGRNRGRGDSHRAQGTRPETQSPQPLTVEPSDSVGLTQTEDTFEENPVSGTGPMQSVHPETDGVPSGDEAFQEGTRRWRGRRGRRGGTRARDPREGDDGTPDRAASHQTTPAQQAESQAAYAAPTPPASSYPGSPSPAQGERVPTIYAVQQPAASTPNVLPGESLSKYGQSRAQSASTIAPELPATPSSAAGLTSRPSTMIEIPLSWDGSGQLPGETISRYRAPEPAATSSVIPAEASAEEEPAPRSSNSEQQVADPSSFPAHSPFEQAYEARQQPQDAASAENILDEDSGDDLAQEELAEELTEEVTEFEPTEASASYRLDPAAPIELRVASTVEDAPPAEHEHPIGFHSVAPASTVANEALVARSDQPAELPVQQVAYASAGEIHEPLDAVAPAEDVSVPHSVAPESSIAATETQARDTSREEAEQRSKPESFWQVVKEMVIGHSSAKEDELGKHEDRITRISQTTSEHAPPEPHYGSAIPVIAASSDETPGQSLAMRYEEDVTGHRPTTHEPKDPEPLSEQKSEEGHHLTEPAAAPFAEPGITPFSDGSDEEGASKDFAPGAGLVEEETIDEEEYDYEPLHASSDEHDLEDLEEETLDHQGGIELGEVVREAHLEQRVKSTTANDAETSEDGYGEDASGGFTEEDFEEPADGAEEEEDDEPAIGEVAAPVRSNSGRTGDRNVERTGDSRGGDRGRGRGRGRRPGQSSGGYSGGGGRRQNTQAADLPPISELLKQGQEILVQIAKEPMAKKGARITSHIALPGRFLVFMPTVNHVGVSRKISSDEERQRLKRILISEKGTATGGFIVRTAADGAGEEDLRADIRFLLSLWNEIKQRSDEAKAPALIYHDLNLIERVLRDQVSDNFTAIWVDSETEYERIVRFLQRFQPSLVRRVKLYSKETPLFEQFGIQEEISKALKSKVWLKSGGSIVINQTEALVAIDINTGKFVGKTARLEDTIVRTNLDAIPEIVRQIRLRDLGGIIVIDFIDMDERKNRNRVLQALEDELKHDRAPSKVLQFNDFGLIAITRKRVKQSLERTLSVQCEVCTGTGMVKSPTTVCNEIYTEMRKMYRTMERKDVMLRVHPEVVKSLKSTSGRWLNELEEMTGKTIIVKSDPALHPEQFDIH